MDIQQLKELERELDRAFARFLEVSGSATANTESGVLLKSKLEKAYQDFIAEVSSLSANAQRFLNDESNR